MCTTLYRVNTKSCAGVLLVCFSGRDAATQWRNLVVGLRDWNEDVYLQLVRGSQRYLLQECTIGRSVNHFVLCRSDLDPFTDLESQVAEIDIARRERCRSGDGR